MILESMSVEPQDVFCTSVPGHQLRFGSTIESQLKAGVNDQQVLFAILTKDSIRSTWVLFELGAAWAIGRLIVPIIGPGIAYSELPGALNQYPCISCGEPAASMRSRIADAMAQAVTLLKIETKSGSKQVAAVDVFIESLSSWKTANTDTAESTPDLSPHGYELYQSDQGATVFRSQTAPAHYLCPTCYGKDKHIVLLQGDPEKSTFLSCKSCRSNYRFHADRPLNLPNMRRDDGFVRNW